MPKDGRHIAELIAGRNSDIPRAKDDFYETPPQATRALLNAVTFDGSIWEPACGAGAISRELDAAGYDVVSTDLVDRGYGISRVDFLMEHKPLAPNIVTNPPFVLLEQFAEKALRLATGKVAIFARLAVLDGEQRARFLEVSPLAMVLVFRKRVGFKRGGGFTSSGDMIAMCWLVWDQSHSGSPTIGWI